MKYLQFSHKCSCGQQLECTYITRYGYIVSCSGCSVVYKGGFWIRGWLLGWCQVYTDDNRFRVFFKRLFSHIVV